MEVFKDVDHVGNFDCTLKTLTSRVVEEYDVMGITFVNILT